MQKYARLIYQMMISDTDLQSAFAFSRLTGKSVELTLIERFQVPKVEIGKSLSHFYKSRFIEYDAQFPIATETFTGLRRFQLLKDCWVPLSWDENGVVVLVDDPYNIDKTEKIKIAIDTSKVIFAVGIKEDIEEFINRGFNEIENMAPFFNAVIGDDPVDVAELLDLIIAEAWDSGAAGIEFEQLSANGEARARFLLDGEWLVFTTFRHDVAMEIASRIKLLAGFHKKDSSLPKLGHIRVAYKDIPEFLLRVTMLPTEDGSESILLKLPTT